MRFGGGDNKIKKSMTSREQFSRRYEVKRTKDLYIKKDTKMAGHQSSNSVIEEDYDEEQAFEEEEET
jgi:hypothetical protein